MTHYLLDPNAKLDYEMDWAEKWLEATETISSYQIDVENCVLDHSSENAGVITYWIKSAEHPAKVTCHIITSMGREDDRSDTFEVRNR